MIKKSILLLAVIISGNCFAQKGPKNKQFILNDKTMKILLQILNPKKQPKQISAPEQTSNPTPVSFNENKVGRHIPKEFECKTKDELTDEFIKNEFVMVPTAQEQKAAQMDKDLEQEVPQGSMRTTPQQFWKLFFPKK